ncbi:MAG: hypothetical protein ACI311_01980 [Bacilli bacterium]
MILKPNHLRNTIILTSCLLIVDILYFLAFIQPNINEMDKTAIIYHIVFYVVLNIPAIFFYTVSIKKSAIEFTSECLKVKKPNGVVNILYKDILYIDEVSALDKKKNYISVFLNNGQSIFLTKDKNNKLYECLISYCKNTISKEEMIKKGYLQ